MRTSTCARICERRENRCSESLTGLILSLRILSTYFDIIGIEVVRR